MTTVFNKSLFVLCTLSPHNLPLMCQNTGQRALEMSLLCPVPIISFFLSYIVSTQIFLHKLSVFSQSSSRIPQVSGTKYDFLHTSFKIWGSKSICLRRSCLHWVHTLCCLAEEQYKCPTQISHCNNTHMRCNLLDKLKTLQFSQNQAILFIYSETLKSFRAGCSQSNTTSFPTEVLYILSK